MKRLLFVTLHIVFFLLVMLQLSVEKSWAAVCGVTVPGACTDIACDTHCYVACRARALPDCVGPMADWDNCCYTGMANSCNPVTSKCDCDFIGAVSVPRMCSGPNVAIPPYVFCGEGFSQLCCDSVASCEEEIPPSPTPTINTPPSGTPEPTEYTPYEPPRKAFFDSVDPLQIGGGETILESEKSAYATLLRSPGGVVSRAMVFIFPLAGLILFFMLVWGGFEMIMGAPSKKSMESGRQRVTAAIVGFLLLFSSYWIWQIIQVVFGVKIL